MNEEGNNQRGKHEPCRLHSGGFTLIATLLIVAVVAVAVIGFLSVVTSRTATTNINAKRAEAQTNALVGLRMAVAQLQEHAGPDQRITATAGILDADRESEEIEGVAEPHWTGVWRTTWDDQGTEYIRRNDRRGGLLDRRTNAPMHTPESKEEKVITWLVSGNERATVDGLSGTLLPERPTATGALAVASDANEDDRMARLVGGGSALREDWVHALKVEIEASETQLHTEQQMKKRPARTSGHYAYWIGDENTKAKVNIINPRADLKIESQNASQGAYTQLALASAAKFDHIWEQAGLDDERKQAVLSVDDYFDLQPQLTNQARIRREAFHSTTAWSLGVLADVRLGGLKRDLTAYFLDDDGEVAPIKAGARLISAGMSDDDNIVGPQNQDAAVAQGISWGRTYHRAAGPNFGRLRDWARLSDEISLRRNESHQVSPAQFTVGDKDVDFSYDYTVRYMPSIEVQSKTALKPVLIEGAVYTAMSRVVVGGVPRLRLHVYPRVVMWNPYNVTLKPQGFALFLAILGQQNFTVALSDGSSRQLKYILPNTNQPLVLDDVDPTEGNLCFAIEPIEFGPGECLVFSADHNGAKAYDLGNIAANRLSAKRFPDVQNFYFDDCFPRQH